MHEFLKFIFGIKLYMFRTVPLSIIRSFSLYTQQWYMSYRFADSLRAGLFLELNLRVSDSSSVHLQEFFSVHTAMVYVSKPICIAVCTVKNSCGRTDELSETCRVIFQK